jgi:hypothetical protein
MVDEIFDRQYREGRRELNDAIQHVAERIGKAVGETFAVLNRIEYAAPWLDKPRRARTH